MTSRNASRIWKCASVWTRPNPACAPASKRRWKASRCAWPRSKPASPRKSRPASTAAPASLEQLERLQPDDIFNRLYRSRYDADTPADLQAAFAELLLTPAGEIH